MRAIFQRHKIEPCASHPKAKSPFRGKFANAGLLPHTEVEFICDGKSVQIIVSGRKKTTRGARLVAHMRGRGSGTLSTKGIMALTRRR
jgi:hypothetical protein